MTQTGTTHYEVQKKRRAGKVEAARRQRPPAVIHLADAALQDNPARRMRRGVYLGADGDRPTHVLDSHLHEVPAHTTSSIHRHSWDAIMFVTEGSGWSEIDGQRIEWRPWDTVYLPSWAWHRHGNEGDRPARYVTWSVAPMYESFGFAVLEDAGDEPFAALPKPPASAAFAGTGSDSYSRRRRRLAEARPAPGAHRLHTRWEDVNPRVTKRGARSMFLVDESIGYKTSGLTAVMHELAPARWQAKHRHGGEAYLYVVTGKGHSEIDGVNHPWSAGDLVVVDHWCWHAHFNDDQENSSRLIRVHNVDALYDLMQILLDPLVLLEELPDLHDAPDLTGYTWPDPNAGRPSF